jgi:hypothetical protein
VPSSQREDALVDDNAGLVGETPVHLGHDAGQLLTAHEHGANAVLVIVERIVEATHIAAGSAEAMSIPASLRTRTMSSAARVSAITNLSIIVPTRFP